MYHDGVEGAGTGDIPQATRCWGGPDRLAREAFGSLRPKYYEYYDDLGGGTKGTDTHGTWQQQSTQTHRGRARRPTWGTGGGERAKAAQSDGTRGTPHVSELEELPGARLLFCGAHALHLLIQLLAHLRHHLLAGGPLDGAGQLGGLTEEELLGERAAEAVEVAQEGRVGVVTCGGEVAALEVAQAAEEHLRSPGMGH